MIALRLLIAVLVSPFRSISRLEADNAALRQQLIVLRRKAKGKAKLTNGDRWLFVQLYRLFPSILEIITNIQPETLVRWHRAGFRRYWRWTSRRRGGACIGGRRFIRHPPDDGRWFGSEPVSLRRF
jgi:hypothetical protein